ncbi:hypothetical protein B7494_g4684 [Chlorociboria aeruginascens]|nr:hypothetical protein B7494_g4684 [Chlorociboria aeruginascens]
MAPIHPRYIARYPAELVSTKNPNSIEVLRTSDNACFLALPIPTLEVEFPADPLDPSAPTKTTHLASALLPSAGVPISRLLNHPNIISLVDIIQASSLPGYSNSTSPLLNFAIFEDMTAGSLSYLLPSLSSLPSLENQDAWIALGMQNFQRFSLPESLCWHVLGSIATALAWLHHGVKETEGIPGEWNKHDDDFHPVLIRDISPGQIWFKRPRGVETYGECKLGGFGWAKVTGVVGGRIAEAERVHDAPDEVSQALTNWTRPAEIWSLGAVLYNMMTGIPPPRVYDYQWNISRMNDKGFSLGLRQIVQDMLTEDPALRPNAISVIERTDAAWREWRGNNAEGAQVRDVRDREVMDKLVGGRGAPLAL